jgi:hypothetical protein
MRMTEQKDWLLAIKSINLTSYLVSYLYMSKGHSPAEHDRVKAGRRAFKNFSRMNSKEGRAFFELY